MPAEFIARRPGDCAQYAVACTPNDGTDLVAPAAIYVGVAGNVAITPVNNNAGASVVFSNVAAGTVLPVLARRVWAAGTTATGLVQVW